MNNLKILFISDLVLKNVVKHWLNGTTLLDISLLPWDDVQFSIITSHFGRGDKTLSSLKILLHLNTYSFTWVLLQTKSFIKKIKYYDRSK